MTINRPMFPPHADQKKCSSLAHLTRAGTTPVFTGAGAEQVENGSSFEPFRGSDAKPAQGDGWVRVDISPEDLFKALGRLRREAEIAIERLIAIVDVIDGNSDLEPSGDEMEPELGSLAGRKGFDQSHWDGGLAKDGEPSLGSPENHPKQADYSWTNKPYQTSEGNQESWAAGNADEREGDDGHDDREGDELAHGGDGAADDYELSGDENEPSLGAFDQLANQEHGWRSI